MAGRERAGEPLGAVSGSVPVHRVRPRLADVAARAGTSKPIASRILNEDPTLTVGQELRARVLAAAGALGYRPNAAARGLRRAETGALGLVVPDLTNQSFTLMLRGAVRRARGRGYAVLLVEDLDTAEPDDTPAQLVLSCRIDGLLVASARPGLPLLEQLSRWRIPHVFANRAVPGSGRNVTLDDAAACRLAVDHLTGLGHRHLGHIAHRLDLEPSCRRAAAFAARTAVRGLPDPVVAEEPHLDERDAAAVAARLLRANPQLTAVFTHSPGLAAGVLAAAASLGRAVPRDLSVLAATDTSVASALLPPLTVIRTPLEELGAAAVDALADQLQGAAPADRVVTTPPELVVRASTGPVNPSIVPA